MVDGPEKLDFKIVDIYSEGGKVYLEKGAKSCNFYDTRKS